MTYDTALEWSVDNVSMDMFDSFEDWLEACKAEFPNADNLFSTGKFVDMMRDAWNNEIGDDEIIEEEEERFELPELPKIPRRETELPNTERIDISREPIGIDTERKSFVPRLPQQLPEIKIPSPQPIILQSPSIQSVRILPPTGSAPRITNLKFFGISSKIRGVSSKIRGVFKR